MKKIAIIVVLGAGITIFLPIAGLSVNAYLLIGVGAAVGFLLGLLGVGGGFLLTPILIMIGVPATVAAASDTNSIVATSASGVATHFRLKNVDLRMGTVALIGGLFGSAFGVYIIPLLSARRKRQSPHYRHLHSHAGRHGRLHAVGQYSYLAQGPHCPPDEPLGPIPCSAASPGRWTSPAREFGTPFWCPSSYARSWA